MGMSYLSPRLVVKTNEISQKSGTELVSNKHQFDGPRYILPSCPGPSPSDGHGWPFITSKNESREQPWRQIWALHSKCPAVSLPSPRAVLMHFLPGPNAKIISGLATCKGVLAQLSRPPQHQSPSQPITPLGQSSVNLMDCGTSASRDAVHMKCR